jgi:uncharacterized protein (TIRG00374 family)
MAVRLRGALLGAGNIALRSHAPKWAGDELLRREVEIVAVADLAPSNRDLVRAILPGARLYDEAEELLEREALDFCDICTPPFTHRRLIESAARRGQHILCEKPLAPTVSDAGEIARVVRETGVVFRPCHQYHYSPQWRMVRQLLPRLGRLHFAEYQVFRTAANEGNPNWSPTWRTNPGFAGGGILVDHGAHILYQLHAVLGEPRTLHAKVARLRHHEYDVEDTACVTLDYGDRMAQVTLTWAACHRAVRLHFVGERGEIWGDDRSVRIHTQNVEDIRFEDGMSKNSWHAEWYTPLMREFHAQMRSSERSTRDLDEAVHVTRLIALAYESARLGRVLSLEPDRSALEPVPDHVDEPATVSRSTSPAPGGPATGPETSPWTLGEPFRSILKYAGLTAIAAFAAWSLRMVQWNELWSAVRAADPRWLGLAAALNLLVIGVGAMRWLALLRPLSRRASLRDAFEATAVGLAVSAVVPARGGEVARMRWLHRRTGLSQAVVAGSIALDQVLNVAGLIVCLAALPLLGGLPDWIRPAAVATIALFGLALVALLVIRPRLAGRHDAPDPARATGLRGVLDRIGQGLAPMRNPRALVRALIASLIAWILEVVVTNLSFRAVGISLPFSASVVVLVAVNLMMAFPISPPGNIGTIEIGATLALIGFGVAKERALAFALCYHALQLLPIGALGLTIAGGRRLLELRWRGAARP